MIRLKDNIILRRYKVDARDTLLLRRKVYLKLLRKWASLYEGVPLDEEGDDSLLQGSESFEEEDENISSLWIEPRKTFFGTIFLMKTFLRFFYFNLSETRLKGFFCKSRRKMLALEYFLGLLELRLCILVVRANFFFRISDAIRFIRLYGVFVNDQLTFNPEYRVSVGDVVSIDIDLWEWSFYTTYKKLLVYSCLDKRWFFRQVYCRQDIFRKFFVPLFLEVNYSIATFIVLRKPKQSDLLYPFEIDFDDIRSLYI